MANDCASPLYCGFHLLSEAPRVLTLAINEGRHFKGHVRETGPEEGKPGVGFVVQIEIDPLADAACTRCPPSWTSRTCSPSAG